MNYQVILNDQVNIIISNVEYIDTKNEFVSFHDEKGNYVAGFKLEGITGFFTMNEPEIDMSPIDIEFPAASHLKLDPEIKLDLKAMAEGIKKKLGYVNPRSFELMQKGCREEPPENWEEEARKDFNVMMEEIYRKAGKSYKFSLISYADIRQESSEVMEEGIKRGIHPHGNTMHLYTRKLIKDKLQRMKGLKKTEKYHYIRERLEEALAKNMEECLYYNGTPL